MGSVGLQYPNIDAALAQFEGFNTQGTIAQRQNNPGNLVAGTFSSTFGGTGNPGQIATFPNAAAGLAAEDALVSQYANQGYDVSELINAWAPGNAPGNTPQSTQNYVNFVSSSLGVSPTTPVSATASTPSTAPISFPFGSSTPTTVPSTTSPYSQAPGYVQSLCNTLGGFANVVPTCAAYALTNANPSLPQPVSNTFWGGLNWGRVGGFILALILIVGAVFLFKPVQEVVTKTVKAGAKYAPALAA